jgi:hypothetical protein
MHLIDAYVVRSYSGLLQGVGVFATALGIGGLRARNLAARRVRRLHELVPRISTKAYGLCGVGPLSLP